jgi:hypothetical protein
MVAGLIDEPYLLTMEEISQLTLRQVVMLYYRKRDDKGKPLPLPYGFDDPEAEKKKVYEFWLYTGMEEEKARRLVYGSW